MKRRAERWWLLWCTWLDKTRASRYVDELSFREDKGFTVTSLEKVLAEGELLTATSAYRRLRGLDDEGK